MLPALPLPPLDPALLSSIFIATPTHICKRYCATEFVNAIIKFAPGVVASILCNSKGDAKQYYTFTNLPQIIYEHVQDSIYQNDKFFNTPESIHMRITGCMNILRQKFLDNPQFKYFWSLESDVIINQSTLPAIMQRMLDTKVGVLHTNCYPGFNTATELSFTERITLGCTMIKREVIEQFPFKYSPDLLKAFHDAFFAIDCVEAGIPMLYDPSIKVEHRHKPSGDRGWEELPFSERS